MMVTPGPEKSRKRHNRNTQAPKIGVENKHCNVKKKVVAKVRKKGKGWSSHRTTLGKRKNEKKNELTTLLYTQLEWVKKNGVVQACGSREKEKEKLKEAEAERKVLRDRIFAEFDVHLSN